MVSCKRKITKDVYDRAMQNKSHYIASEDYEKVFDVSEICGYGVYGAIAKEIDGEYYCLFDMGSSCD
jgi:hypothetical protein